MEAHSGALHVSAYTCTLRPHPPIPTHNYLSTPTYTNTHTHTHIHLPIRTCTYPPTPTYPHTHLSTPTPTLTPTLTPTHTEPYRRSSTTHYDEEHGEGDMELDTSTQETTGGWMEVQPTNQKAAAPQVSVNQNNNIVMKLEAHDVSHPEHVETSTLLVFVTEGRSMFKV